MQNDQASVPFDLEAIKKRLEDDGCQNGREFSCMADDCELTFGEYCFACYADRLVAEVERLREQATKWQQALANSAQASADASSQLIIERAKVERLAQCEARFDLLHFEHVGEQESDEDPDEMLDPSALLIVLDALVELTSGVGVDPASGTLL